MVEKVEPVSRGGRKLKLKDWWSGVVTDATSPRSKTNVEHRFSLRTSVTVARCRETSMKAGKTKKKGSLHSIDTGGEESKTAYQPDDGLQSDISVLGSRDATFNNLSDISMCEPNTADVSTQLMLKPNTANVSKQLIFGESLETEATEKESVLPTVCKKKRGRKRKNYFKTLKQNKEKAYSNSSLEMDGEVKCGKCGSLCNSLQDFRSHAQSNHNGLARPDGDSQDFTEDEAKNIYFSTIKAGKTLKCARCLNEYRSPVGYMKHILHCGISQEDLNILCKICNKQFRYYSMDLHVKNKHSEKVKEPKKTSSSTSSGPRPRRRAASNCNVRLQVWRSNKPGEGGSCVSDPEDDYQKELNLSQFYLKLNGTMPEDCNKRWKTDLAHHGKAACPNEGCTFTLKTLYMGHKHFQNCPFLRSSKTFNCKFCSFVSVLEDDIKNHITSDHADEFTRSFEGSDVETSDDEYDNPRRAHRNCSKITIGQLKPFLLSLHWTLEFLNATVSEKLFSEFSVLRENWTILHEQVAAKYLPSVKCSPKFKIHTVADDTNNAVQEWQELNQFKGTIQGKGYAIFCGGPVIASAWCPQPSLVSLASDTQYLALSSLSSPEKTYHILKSAVHEGLIQIWEFSCPKENGEQTAKFLFGIAHDFGNVWSLIWCPSGSFELSDDTSVDKDNVSRLGLLAAACSDGTVRIFAIPHFSNTDMASSKIYKALPKVTLSPGKLYRDGAQCLKVDWCRGKGHAFIAGALSTGVVCIWDVTCSSPLVKVKDIQNNLTFYPVNSFLAHNGVCSVVAFCPTTDGRNLLSGGNDRTYKFWDLENTDMPLSITRKGLVLDAVWLPHWAGCFISFDDVYGLTNTNTCFRENGFFGIQSRNVLSSNAPVWSITASDWLNAVAQGDSAGEVMITVQQQLFKNYENDKFPSKRKVPVLSVHLQNISQASPVSFRVGHDSKQLATSENLHAKASKKPKKPRVGQDERDTEEEDGLCPASYTEWPRTYLETLKNYGLVFVDQDTENFSQIPDREMAKRKRSDTMEPGPVACYPMMAVTSVAWNNNIGACTWIFIGTQSGLGRLVNVKALNTDEARDFISNTWKRKMKGYEL